MCLIIWKPASRHFEKAEIANYYKHNPDGFGVSWHDHDNKVRSMRMVGGKKKVWRAYKQFAEGRNCALHFRWATGGAINVENAHPFLITPSVSMMHNGILKCKSSDEFSDTWFFAKVMERELADEKATRLLQADYTAGLTAVIGPSNVLLFLIDNVPEPVILNRQNGIEHKGCWYSNTYAWSLDNPDYFDWSYLSYQTKYPTSKQVVPYVSQFDQAGDDDDDYYDEALQDIDNIIALYPAASFDFEVDQIAKTYARGEKRERLKDKLWRRIEDYLARGSGWGVR